jgi:hypothetical protein
MKIKVVKKGDTKTKPGTCPWFIDEPPPMAK